MEYYIYSNNAKKGPFSLEELKNQSISHNTMIWKVGFSNWTPASQVPELADMLSEIPPELVQTNPIMPKTWLIQSIIATTCCCLPFGIAGIVNATKVESYYMRGDYANAIRCSENAKKWTIWAVISGFIVTVAYVILIIVLSVLIYMKVV